MITLRSLRALRCLILFTAEHAKVAKIRSKRVVLIYNVIIMTYRGNIDMIRTQIAEFVSVSLKFVVYSVR